MYKLNRVALFGILSILLLSGCTQEQSEPNNKDSEIAETNEQSQASDSSESEEKTTNSSTPKTEEVPQVADSKKEDSDLTDLKVHYIDVGQADSTLIQFSHENEDFTILIDAGNWNKNDVITYLDTQNVSEIDIAIGTHPDADHIGQLDKVLNRFDVGEVWLSGNTSNSQTFQRLLNAIDSNDVDYYEPRTGDEFQIGPLEIDVLYPRTVSENDNEESISLKLTYNEVRFVFTGDASKSDEVNMLKSGINLEADILHLGHHGSSTSTNASFLNDVNPSVAIYSAGSDNSYGHPHDEVVKLVQNSGSELYGTDVHGTIIASTNGFDYQILTNKDGTISPSSNKNTTGSDSTGKQDSTSKKPESTNSCIDVNSATVEQVQEITHIGPARAEEMLVLRPYDSVNDLAQINGIGSARIEEIKSEGLACIGG
ncbi:MBL fold metallo-hydrolase [Aquibacillus saliphilus]|uniref:MBL fold metallo-hydrolase n=1 Tax=Aquibacillus saliphilus TaxID=1909422 RepID=UPI001CF06665|nr:MBL fold metallo-hydrolase [Aquibacillus saliphilus]